MILHEHGCPKCNSIWACYIHGHLENASLCAGCSATDHNPPVGFVELAKDLVGKYFPFQCEEVAAALLKLQQDTVERCALMVEDLKNQRGVSADEYDILNCAAEAVRGLKGKL